MEAIALKEDIDIKTLMQNVADGKVVILKNKNHENVIPTAVGEGLTIKVNANIGTSMQRSSIEQELTKLQIIEQLPEFPGGWVMLMKWLDKNIKYPPEALKEQIQGEVTVSFIINTNGTLNNIKITESSDPLLNAEALRVVHKMPRWKPGIHHNKPCTTMFSIPIVFHL